MATQANTDLGKAKKEKNDEFYTSIDDIETELKHYKEHFKGKVVLCNCDDPEWSNFWQFFTLKFDFFEMKKLITTHYVGNGASENGAYSLEVFKNEDGSFETKKTPLTGNGDFRSDECIEFLKEADIVVTNPPFSLFREYVATLEQHCKQYVILGNLNGLTYKELFPLFRDNKLWFGPSISSGDREFRVPDSYPLRASGFRIDDQGNKYIRVKGVRWFTNMQHYKRNEEIILWKKYNKEDYPNYDNYNAINVDKVADIPIDYDGAMGVPITFIDKYNPEQFEILNANDYIIDNRVKQKPHGLIKDKDGAINGKPKYARIVIKHKR